MLWVLNCAFNLNLCYFADYNQEVRVHSVKPREDAKNHNKIKIKKASKKEGSRCSEVRCAAILVRKLLIVLSSFLEHEREFYKGIGRESIKS